ncbi:MAG: von Willebrand factor type A domain-containing protein [Candidatus Aminicenantes bacterium]|nr:von Willebrand factor type A domain-containing protein [Candidatus Aminicenantes bacterium]
MKTQRFAITVIGILTGLMLFLGLSLAENTISLEGIITDNHGTTVSGVKVVAQNTNTQILYNSKTDSKGHFAFRNLPAGMYDVWVELPGFQAVKQTGIHVRTGKTALLNFTLHLEGNTIVPAQPVEAELADEKSDKRVLGGVVGGVLTGAHKEAHYRHKSQVAAPFQQYPQNWNTEEYGRIYENSYLLALDNPLSTFSIDVDTASYSNVRRFINSNQFPYKDAVRIEEMINYFSYDYPLPKDNHPFSIYTEISTCPWNDAHRLIHIGLQGKELETKKLPPSNLVFLLDVSGSMSPANKLPLLQHAFKLLVKELGANDRVSIVVYAGAAGLVLPSTAATQEDAIIAAIDRLHAGGSTAGGAGIKLAYKVAEENFIQEGNNRIILATDGDFNIGVSSTSELVRMIEDYRKKGIFLTILGFGMGNYKDGRMEQLADKGNGNYYYIDNLMEAKKVFVNDMRGTLFTIAKDVKLQLEFNPAKVKAYRLIGYENRLLKKEDFADDTKDAGELGAGHTVTALYEIIPYGSQEEIPGVDDLKYQDNRISPEALKSKEIMTLKLRYKKPDGNKSKLIVHPLKDRNIVLAKTSDNFKFSSAVAAFGMLLRDSEFKGTTTYESVLNLARNGKGKDFFGYRSEFIQLVEKCSLLESVRPTGN